MERTIKTLKSSDLYRKIDVSGLTGSERLEAIGVLKAAWRLNDALNSGIELFSGFARWVAPKPQAQALVRNR